MAEARPLLRTCLETYEDTLRSDMVGGNESVDLILPLMLLSYADMLAGTSRLFVLFIYFSAKMPADGFNGGFFTGYLILVGWTYVMRLIYCCPVQLLQT